MVNPPHPEITGDRIWCTIEAPGLGDLGANTWVGNPSLPADQQGITVLGVPVGTPAFVQSHLQTTLANQRPLLESIPQLDDVQASWLLLLYTASPRCNYLLRLLPREATAAFADNHDLAITTCLSQLLQTANLPATAMATAHLPLSQGGLGLTPASLTATPAFWASWADALPVLHRQAASVTQSILQQLAHPEQAPAHIQAATNAAAMLQQEGWEPPAWHTLTNTQPPPTPSDGTEGPTQPGLQKQAAARVYTNARSHLVRLLDPSAQAMLDSQSGPYASRAFTTIPYTEETTYPSHLFRLLMLRRLRLPLPLSQRSCRCRRTVDQLGDHQAACARSGVLRSRGGPLEHAAARICREAGARVTTNTRIADLNIQAVHHQDDRRIEVIANGLPLWNGTQLAIDTTLVSPLTSNGQPRTRAGTYAGTAVREARRAKERTYPELLGSGRCRLVVLALEIGGRWSDEAAQFLKLLAQSKAQTVPAPLRPSTTAALLARWSAILTRAAMHAFASSLLSLPCTGLHNGEGELPPLGTLLCQHPAPIGAPSRLPLRQ